jgi:type II secretory pathway pseudopilin PulG
MPKRYGEQEITLKKAGFTLVEIMIVILIIIMLTQLGNLGSLFRIRERSQIEEIAVKIVATLDEEKTHALLWKTENGKIVRKRLSEITIKNPENTIEIDTKVNLADTDETIYNNNQKKKTWSLPTLETFLYECPPIDNTPLEGIPTLKIEFINENIYFRGDALEEIPNHLVILLTSINTSHEIHIDRRTGLTYEIEGKWKDSAGKWQITCN